MQITSQSNSFHKGNNLICYILNTSVRWVSDAFWIISVNLVSKDREWEQGEGVHWWEMGGIVQKVEIRIMETNLAFFISLPGPGCDFCLGLLECLCPKSHRACLSNKLWSFQQYKIDVTLSIPLVSLILLSGNNYGFHRETIIP